MVIKLNVPALDKDKRLKDIIINILSFEWPLTLTQINNKAHKEFQVSTSYQATYKALNELTEEKVLIKQDNNYSLNTEWAQKLKEFSENLLKNYGNKDKAPILEGLLNIKQDAGTATLTFDCLASLDKAWLKIKEDFYKSIKNKNEVSIWEGNHCWWLLVYPEKEYEVIKEAKKKNANSYKLIHCDTHLDRWSEKFYKDSGTKVKIIKSPIEGDMGVFGDTIMQVKHPEEIKIELEKIYQKCKTPSDINIPDFIKNVLEKKVKMNLILTYNKEIADKLKDNAIKNYKSK